MYLKAYMRFKGMFGVYLVHPSVMQVHVCNILSRFNHDCMREALVNSSTRDKREEVSGLIPILAACTYTVDDTKPPIPAGIYCKNDSKMTLDSEKDIDILQVRYRDTRECTGNETMHQNV
jgi:hypothetical protein